MNLRGNNLVTLDSKGRIIVPAQYRTELKDFCESKLVLSYQPNGDTCLVLYPLPNWQNVEDKIRQMPSQKPIVRKLKRIFLGGAANIKMDKNHRMVLPLGMREACGLTKEIMLVGVGSSFELWDKDLWNKEGYEINSLGDLDEESNEIMAEIIF